MLKIPPLLPCCPTPGRGVTTQPNKCLVLNHTIHLFALPQVVVYHPTSVSPTEVQEQLTKMSSQYVMKVGG